MKSHFFDHHKWFNHFKIKSLSLLAALVLWLFIATDKYYEHTLNVSLNLTGLAILPLWSILRSYSPINNHFHPLSTTLHHFLAYIRKVVNTLLDYSIHKHDMLCKQTRLFPFLDEARESLPVLRDRKSSFLRD